MDHNKSNCLTSIQNQNINDLKFQNSSGPYSILLSAACFTAEQEKALQYRTDKSNKCVFHQEIFPHNHILYPYASLLLDICNENEVNYRSEFVNHPKIKNESISELLQDLSFCVSKSIMDAEAFCNYEYSNKLRNIISEKLNSLSFRKDKNLENGCSSLSNHKTLCQVIKEIGQSSNSCSPYSQLLLNAASQCLNDTNVTSNISDNHSLEFSLHTNKNKSNECVSHLENNNCKPSESNNLIKPKKFLDRRSVTGHNKRKNVHTSDNIKSFKVKMNSSKSSSTQNSLLQNLLSTPVEDSMNNNFGVSENKTSENFISDERSASQMYGCKRKSPSSIPDLIPYSHMQDFQANSKSTVNDSSNEHLQKEALSISSMLCNLQMYSSSGLNATDMGDVSEASDSNFQCTLCSLYFTSFLDLQCHKKLFHRAPIGKMRH